MARAWGVLVAGLALFGAGFLPWIVIRIVKGSGGEVWTIRIWGWVGALKPLGVPLPNAIVPSAGLACAVLAAAVLAGRLRAPWKILFGLALYAFVRATVCVVFSRNYGIGLPLSASSALVLAVLSLPRKAPPAPSVP